MAWEQIGYQVLGSAAASVTFSSGLSGYKFFRLSAYIANDANVKATYVRFNGDSGANYVEQRITVQSTTVSGARIAGMSEINPIEIAQLASESASFQMIIAKPSSSLKAQTIEQAGVNTSPSLSLIGNEWDNTSDSITSLSIISSAGNFAAGTSVLLEGLAL